MVDGTDWTTVLVALASGATGAAGTFGMHWLQGGNERKSVRASILAEIRALIELVEKRQYVPALIEECQNLSLRVSTCTPFSLGEVQPMVYQVTVPENYNLIFRENSSKLGCLEPQDAADVVRFYQLIQSVIVDIGPGGFLYEGARDPNQVYATISIFENALAIGSALLERSDARR
ncbi:hypothetical protein [Pseudomonas sp. SCB32]|uniref:hypothetical protein n=1 Tax=Pseudomonas sp. SCB32 TaxID=2653853 RepID=UPI0012641B20|nr:hypothetical protein [Pseudomonas sp. SCB32]